MFWNELMEFNKKAKKKKSYFERKNVQLKLLSFSGERHIFWMPPSRPLPEHLSPSPPTPSSPTSTAMHAHYLCCQSRSRRKAASAIEHPLIVFCYWHSELSDFSKTDTLFQYGGCKQVWPVHASPSSQGCTMCMQVDWQLTRRKLEFYWLKNFSDQCEIHKGLREEGRT